MRATLAALGIANTEGIMIQGDNLDETQRRLTAEDVATLRLQSAGLNRIQGDFDDNGWILFGEHSSNCENHNLKVGFGTNTAAVSTELELETINSQSQHRRIKSATITFNPTIAWYFNTGNTSTQVTSTSPTTPVLNQPFTIHFRVNKLSTAMTGDPSGVVKVEGPLGTCSATLVSASTGSCSITPTTNPGTTLLSVKYQGNLGFDSSKTDIQVLIGNPAPPVVTGLSISGSPLPCGGNVCRTLNWLPVSNITRYEIQTSDLITFASLTSETSTTQTNSSVRLGYARVRACNATACGQWSTPLLVDGSPFVTGLNTTGGPFQCGDLTVLNCRTLNWNAVVGAVSYEVQQSNTSTFGVIFDSFSTPQTTGNARVGYARVRACLAPNTCGSWSAPLLIGLYDVTL